MHSGGSPFDNNSAWRVNTKAQTKQTRCTRSHQTSGLLHQNELTAPATGRPPVLGITRRMRSEHSWAIYSRAISNLRWMGCAVVGHILQPAVWNITKAMG